MKAKLNSLKGLLLANLFLEGATGLALMATPSMVIQLLLGSSLIDPVGLIITRLAGSGLIAFAMACWFVQKNENAIGLITAVLIYNLTSALCLDMPDGMKT